MSIWKTSSLVVADEDGRVYPNDNAFAWQELLNSLDPGSGSDSAPEKMETGVVARLSPYFSSSTALDSAETCPNERNTWCHQRGEKFFSGRGSNPVVSPADGYTSEDEHDSSRDLVTSDSGSSPRHPPLSSTLTRQTGSVDSAALTPPQQDSSASCFFINGVRHLIDSPRSGAESAKVPLLPGNAMSNTFTLESPPWATKAIDAMPTTGSTPARVVAGNGAGAASEWASKLKVRTLPPPSEDPPAYVEPHLVPMAPPRLMSVPMRRTTGTTPNSATSLPHSHSVCGGCGVGATMSAFSSVPSVTAPLGTYGVPTMVPPTFLPCPPLSSLPPFHDDIGNTGGLNANYPVFNVVGMDAEGRLCMIPPWTTGPPTLPLSAVSAMPIPTGGAPHIGAPSLPRRPDACQAPLLSCRFSPSTTTTPVPNATSPGNAMAWMFRDGRWISLSV